jgi:hypothetical protein
MWAGSDNHQTVSNSGSGEFAILASAVTTAKTCTLAGARIIAEKGSRSEHVATKERGTGARLAGAPEARGGNAPFEGSLKLDASLRD